MELVLNPMYQLNQFKEIMEQVGNTLLEVRLTLEGLEERIEDLEMEVFKNGKD